MIALYDTEEVEKRIKEVLPILIDAFVELYGEEHRDTIQERIAATKLFLYNKPLIVKQEAKKDLANDSLDLEQKERLNTILNNAEEELDQRRKLDVEVTKLFLAEIVKKYPEKMKNTQGIEKLYNTERDLYCSGIETEGCVAAFSKEKLDALHSSHTNAFVKFMIRDNQITYLRKKVLILVMPIMMRLYNQKNANR